jgi:hypothetical protein
MRNIVTCTPRQIYLVIKSRGSRWANYIARMGEKAKRNQFVWENQKERDRFEDTDVGGRILLK